MLNEHGIFYYRYKVDNKLRLNFHKLSYLSLKNDSKTESFVWVEGRSFEEAIYNLNKLCYYWTRSGYEYYVKPFVKY